ncbi:hypothetical protein ACF0H5_018988 [Mactra antiquata]
MAFAIVVISIGSGTPYDVDLDEFNLGDIDDSSLTYDDIPVKRGMCRAGFTYHSVLRNCLPSLGALRGRGRGGRRGRRGMSW